MTIGNHGCRQATCGLAVKRITKPMRLLTSSNWRVSTSDVSSIRFYSTKTVLVLWLVVSTHLKNISQIGLLPQMGVKIKNIWNHHLVLNDLLEYKLPSDKSGINITIHYEKIFLTKMFPKFQLLPPPGYEPLRDFPGFLVKPQGALQSLILVANLEKLNIRERWNKGWTFSSLYQNNS